MEAHTAPLGQLARSHFATATGVQPRPTKVFFKTLDGMRGLAALLIVVRHTGALFDPVTFQESFLAVDVFFVLSGVVLAQAYEARLLAGLGTLRFTWLRLVRIYPLYFLGGLIAALTIVCGLDTYHRLSHLGTYAALGLFLLPNPGIGSVYVYPLVNPSWSLFLELVANVAYAALVRRLNTAAVYAIMLAASIGLVVTLCFDQAHNLDIGFRYRALPFGLFRVTYSFLAGVLIYRRYAARPHAAVVRHATAKSCALIAAVGAVLAAGPQPAIQPLYDFAAVTVVFPLLIAASLRCQPSGTVARLCTFLGAISYAIYALHAPLGDLVQDLWPASGLASPQAFAPWGGLVFLSLMIPLCWAADACYDAPIRRRLLALTRPTGRAPTPPPSVGVEGQATPV